MPRAGTLVSLFGAMFDQSRTVAATSDDRPIIEQCRTLMSARGEASTLRLARSILATYRTLSEDDRLAFYRYLADELDIDGTNIARHATAYEADPTPEHFQALMTAAEPLRQTLFRKLNQAEGATAQLVALRNDLIDARKIDPAFARIDIDLAHLFASWFNRGFLVLERIDWSTPARILEKIIDYEAVHEINDWNDLRRRTEPLDRRCYAYVHPRMPNDPLIFVEIALTKGVPASVQEVLAEDRTPLAPQDADTAIFYSISNCQRGLRGISFGESLIKQVVADLSSDLPQLKEFITLSPVPRLRTFVDASDEVPADLKATLAAAADAAEAGDRAPLDAMAGDLSTLVATAIATRPRADGLPWDSVARFHLSNGAEFFNVLPGANLSPYGLAQSYGAMVNYRYKLADVEARSERFVTERTIPLSRRVQSLIKDGKSLLRADAPTPEIT